jgi:hypothetical protein
LPGQRLTNNVRFELTLVIAGEMPKIGPTDPFLRFTRNVGFWPHVWDTVGARLDNVENIGEGVGFFDVGDYHLDNLSRSRTGNKHHLTVHTPQAKTAVHYLANLKGEGLASVDCHPPSLRNDFCAGVSCIDLPSEATDPQPGGSDRCDS